MLAGKFAGHFAGCKFKVFISISNKKIILFRNVYAMQSDRNLQDYTT
jgi:hypothetical protein